MEKKKHDNNKAELLNEFTGLILKGITFLVTTWVGAYLGAAMFLIGYWVLVWGR